jgi:hypothetical protein
MSDFHFALSFRWFRLSADNQIQQQCPDPSNPGPQCQAALSAMSSQVGCVLHACPVHLLLQLVEFLLHSDP